VSKEGGVGSNRIYALIAIFIIVIIILAIVFSTSNLTPAYVPDDFLDGGWSEDLMERAEGSQLFGLEKWCSLTYKIDDRYPAYLTITTLKTLIMMGEKELKERTMETVEKALEQGIKIDNKSEITGERVLYNTHKTIFIMYDGNDTTKSPPERIKIIGEVWNCGVSGKSVICIGFAQITDYAHDNPMINTTNWKKIIRDEIGFTDFVGKDGLIYNVICH